MSDPGRRARPALTVSTALWFDVHSTRIWAGEEMGMVVPKTIGVIIR
jgi:hypothetical protein